MISLALRYPMSVVPVTPAMMVVVSHRIIDAARIG